MSYFKFDVSTITRTYYENPALFPKVTIRNVNPFTTRYALEFLKKINMELNRYKDIFNEDQMSELDFSVKNDVITVMLSFLKREHERTVKVFHNMFLAFLLWL